MALAALLSFYPLPNAVVRKSFFKLMLWYVVLCNSLHKEFNQLNAFARTIKSNLLI